MYDLMDLFGFLSAGFPLLALLCVSGVTATAAGIYYYCTYSNEEHTPLTEDSVQTGSVGVSPDLMPDEDRVNVNHTASEDPWSATEEENQEVEVTSALVDSVRAELEHRVRELEELLREAHRECERKTKDSGKKVNL
ncbi:uncharacterized protein Hap1MRO34_002419 [Clarias gariepinus]